MRARLYRDRRRAQAGTTLVELIVSLTIMGLALSLIVGTLSTGLLNSSVAKRDTAAAAVVQYEMDEIAASAYNAAAPSYSDCFATENPQNPVSVAYESSCPDVTFALRTDVSWASGPLLGAQTWTISVVAWPAGERIGSPVQVIKVNR